MRNKAILKGLAVCSVSLLMLLSANPSSYKSVLHVANNKQTVVFAARHHHHKHHHLYNGLTLKQHKHNHKLHKHYLLKHHKYGKHLRRHHHSRKANQYKIGSYVPSEFRQSNSAKALRKSGFVNVAKKYDINTHIIFNKYAPNDSRAVVPNKSKHFNIYNENWCEGKFGSKYVTGYSYNIPKRSWRIDFHKSHGHRVNRQESEKLNKRLSKNRRTFNYNN